MSASQNLITTTECVKAEYITSWWISSSYLQHTTAIFFSPKSESDTDDGVLAISKIPNTKSSWCVFSLFWIETCIRIVHMFASQNLTSLGVCFGETRVTSLLQTSGRSTLNTFNTMRCQSKMGAIPAMEFSFSWKTIWEKIGSLAFLKFLKTAMMVCDFVLWISKRCCTRTCPCVKTRLQTSQVLERRVQLRYCKCVTYLLWLLSTYRW
jgi:hypothetical protein